MARKSVYIPDDVHERVVDHGGVEDSYSGIVTEALQEFLDRQEDEQPAD